MSIPCLFPNVNWYSCAAVSKRSRNAAEILPQTQEKIQGSFLLVQKISTNFKKNREKKVFTHVGRGFAPELE